MIENIQQLFTLIPASNVMRYLDSHGWRREESGTEAVVKFGSPAETDVDTSRVWIFSTETHPQYRRQLPNVIFTLAVFEDREAILIANEMFQAKAPAKETTVADGASATRRFVVRHGLPTDSQIWVAPTRTTYPWRGGDRLEMLITGAGEPPALTVREDALTLDAWSPDEFRAFLSSPPPAEGTRATVRAIVFDELGRLSDFEFESSRETCQAALTPVLDRIDFDLPTAAGSEPLPADTCRRQGARAAVSVAKQLRAVSTSQAAVWRILQRLVGYAALALEFDAWAIDELWMTAFDDSPEFPRATLQWLERRALATAKVD